jgi:lysophospholipase L1-like esterase
MILRAGRYIATCLLGVLVLTGSSVAHLGASAEGAGVYIASGDSVAAGIGASLPRTRGYPALVADWLQASGDGAIILENLAVPGETTASFQSDGQLDRLISVIATASEADIPIVGVSVTLGGNEMLRLRSEGLSDRQEGLERFRADYETVLGIIRETAGPAVPIIVTTYYELTEGDGEAEFSDAWWVRQFNMAIRDAADSANAIVADIETEFAGQVLRYTHYPFDVHPTNAGHSAIARIVASSMSTDLNPPTIDVVSSAVATRQTPTLRFHVHDDSGVASVQVTSDDVVIHGPFSMGNGEYIALLQPDRTAPDTAALTITSSDVLGRRVTVEVTITYMLNEGGSR